MTMGACQLSDGRVRSFNQFYISWSSTIVKLTDIDLYHVMHVSDVHEAKTEVGFFHSKLISC